MINDHMTATQELVPGDVIVTLNGTLKVTELCKISKSYWKITGVGQGGVESYEAFPYTLWNTVEIVLEPEKRKRDDHLKWLETQRGRYVNNLAKSEREHNHIDAFKWKMKVEAFDNAIHHYREFLGQ